MDPEMDPEMDPKMDPKMYAKDPKMDPRMPRWTLPDRTRRGPAAESGRRRSPRSPNHLDEGHTVITRTVRPVWAGTTATVWQKSRACK
jgi:hypothetical protein